MRAFPNTMRAMLVPRLLSPLAFFVLLAAFLGGAPVAAEDAAAGDVAETDIDFMNGVYTDLNQNIQPVERGGMVIHITSPEHRLTVHGNRLELRRNADGTIDATLEVDFEGEGRIIAELVSGAMKNKFEDRVAAPRQTVSVSGRARLESVEGGYLMTVVDGPPSVELQIQSDLASNLLGLCKTFEKLPLLPINCAGLETALSVVSAPLPEPGEEFLVPAVLLTDDEKAFFDRFAS